MTFSIICLIGWTISSVWFFLYNLGEKYRAEKWYDNFMLVPTFVIITLFERIAGLLKTVIRYVKG